MSDSSKLVQTIAMSTERQPLSLLLVDDDKVSRELILTMIRQRHLPVEAREDGPSALRLMDEEHYAPSLILMDARMPGMSGEELLAALRSRTQARIVLISASDPSLDLCNAADDFLLKPFGVAELNRILTEHQMQLKARQTARPIENVDALQGPDLEDDALDRLRNMMPESAVREIYTALLADLDQRTDALRQALNQRDSLSIRRIGHAIKGGASMCGATRIARLGSRLENGELDSQLPGLNPPAPEQAQNETNPLLFLELRDAVARLRRMLLDISLLAQNGSQ